jgi:hypothetical protein
MNLILILGISPFILFRRTRIYFVIWAAIFAFGPAEVGIQKYLYLSGLLIAAILSFLNLLRLPQSDNFIISVKRMRYILIIAIMLYILNFSAATYNGFDSFVIFRQLLPILLFILGFIVVVDVSGILTPKSVSFIIISVGLFSAVNTFIRWSQLRGATQFSVERLGLDTDLLGLLALLLVSSPIQKLRWRKGIRLLVGTLIVGFFTGTFSRSFFPSFAIIAVYVLVNRKDRIFTGALKFFLALASGAILVLIGLKLSGLLDSSIFLRRYVNSFISLRKGGLSESGLGSDPSLMLRKSQGDFARNIWQENKYFGTGILDPIITMDNFMGSFAANGLVGMFLLVTIYLGTVISIGRSRLHNSIADFISKGFLLLLIVYSIIGNWPMNKSAWLALLLILLLYFSEITFDNRQRRVQI